MAGTVKNLGGFAIKIGGYYDRVHLLITIPAKVSVSSFVGQLKANTSRYINQTSDKIAKFGWQDGFGVFTVSPSQQDNLKLYIENQIEHHTTRPFEDEYVELLNRQGVEFDPQYVWARTQNRERDHECGTQRSKRALPRLADVVYSIESMESPIDSV